MRNKLGTPATINLECNEGTIHIYQHWDGYDIAKTVANALDRGRSRWDDDEYLNRIIFSEVIKDDIDGETGYGLGIGHYSESYQVDISHGNQRVAYDGEEYSFEEFVKEYIG